MHWGDKDTSGVGRGREHPQDGKLGTDGFSTAGGRSDKDVVVCVVEGVEDLGLNGVKVGEVVAVEGLVGGVPEGGDWEGLQVQQLRGRGELLRQDEVAERDGKLRLGGNPTVRHHLRKEGGGRGEGEGGGGGGGGRRGIKYLPLPPPDVVATHLDEVLWWQWLEHRHKEADDVFVGGILALEQEILVVQDYLAIHILHQDPECLGFGR